MSFFKKIFGKDEAAPENSVGNFPYVLGRYSGSGKSNQSFDAWGLANVNYAAGDYISACCNTLDYLKFSVYDNVSYSRTGNEVNFTLQQGSALLKGRITPQKVHVTADLAIMKTPSVAVMRRLLERNFSLNYARTALEDNRLYMLYDTDTPSFNPNKMYSALSELALKADQMDEVLVADFNSLEATENHHIVPYTDRELQVRYDYFIQLIDTTFQQFEPLNRDTYSGTISYLLLTLLCSIDYLILPHGKMLADIEEIYNIYWKNREALPAVEVNQRMATEIQKRLRSLSKEQFAQSVYKGMVTFPITGFIGQQQFIDAVDSAIKESQWYVNNNHPQIAPIIVQYAVANSYYNHTLPDVIDELSQLFMMVNHSDYCEALAPGFGYYNKSTGKVDAQKVSKKVQEILARYQQKYPKLKFDLSKINFENLYKFNVSFVFEISNSNLSTQ